MCVPKTLAIVPLFRRPLFRWDNDFCKIKAHDSFSGIIGSMLEVGPPTHQVSLFLGEGGGFGKDFVETLKEVATRIANHRGNSRRDDDAS